MGATHISAADLARDPDAVLARAVQGEQIVIGTGRDAVVMQREIPRGRSISESIQRLEEFERRTGERVVMDEDFARDMAEIIALRKPRKSLYDDE